MEKEEKSIQADTLLRKEAGEEPRPRHKMVELKDFDTEATTTGLTDLAERCIELDGKFQIRSLDGKHNCCSLQILDINFCQYYNSKNMKKAQKQGEKPDYFAVCKYVDKKCQTE